MKAVRRIIDVFMITVSYIAGLYTMHYVDRVQWAVDQSADDIANNRLVLIAAFYGMLVLAYLAFSRLVDYRQKENSPHA